MGTSARGVALVTSLLDAAISNTAAPCRLAARLFATIGSNPSPISDHASHQQLDATPNGLMSPPSKTACSFGVSPFLDPSYSSATSALLAARACSNAHASSSFSAVSLSCQASSFSAHSLRHLHCIARPLSAPLLRHRPQPSPPSSVAQSVRHLRRDSRTFPLPPKVATALKGQMVRPKLPEPQLPPPSLKALKLGSRRVGCIAVKAGMTQEWDEWGVQVPLTVLWVDECQVVGLKFPQRDGYSALQVGAGYRPQKSVSPGAAGFYLKQGVPFKAEQVEFRVSPDAMLPVGTLIGASHFVVGQRVDVTGWTKWKGFQGVMKKWGFAGMPASHGTSLTHRSAGSIGSRQDPGKVFKGKHMAGNMGDERRTVHNALVYRVDAEKNLIYVRGQVPGPAGQFIYLRDALNTPEAARAAWNIPFPTTIASPQSTSEGGALGDVSVYRNPTDPYRMYSEETDYFEVAWKKSD